MTRAWLGAATAFWRCSRARACNKARTSERRAHAGMPGAAFEAPRGAATATATATSDDHSDGDGHSDAQPPPAPVRNACRLSIERGPIQLAFTGPVTLVARAGRGARAGPAHRLQP